MAKSIPSSGAGAVRIILKIRIIFILVYAIKGRKEIELPTYMMFSMKMPQEL